MARETGEADGAPIFSIRLSQAEVEGFARLLTRSLNRNQMLILSELRRPSNNITSLLAQISERSEVPLSTLKLNARILRDLNLITYGSGSRTPRLTEVGILVLKMLEHDIEEVLNPALGLSEKLEERSGCLKKTVEKTIGEAGSGHLGPSLSCLDMLLAIYTTRISVRDDVLILSKGHAAPALYAVLAEVGIIRMEELDTLRSLDSRLQGHPEAILPGVVLSTGSLGQGLSVGNGVALASKLSKQGRRVYVVVGDGELDEGQIWEAAMTAAQYVLDNVTVIVDRNGFQHNGPTQDVKRKDPLKEKWEAFGWEVEEIDGHDFQQILWALDRADKADRPFAVIARTSTTGSNSH